MREVKKCVNTTTLQIMQTLDCRNIHHPVHRPNFVNERHVVYEMMVTDDFNRSTSKMKAATAYLNPLVSYLPFPQRNLHLTHSKIKIHLAVTSRRKNYLQFSAISTTCLHLILTKMPYVKLLLLKTSNRSFLGQ